jgi:hypothetical protein
VPIEEEEEEEKEEEEEEEEEFGDILSETYISLNVKYLLFLSHFNES